MNQQAVYRIFWKEAVEQLPFCIGIFALMVAIQSAIATMLLFNAQAAASVPGIYYGAALFMTAVYAASSAALLLTAETDRGTFTLLRTMPLSPWTFLTGKLGWTLVSTLVLALVAWGETLLWAGGMLPESGDTSMIFLICGIGIIEAIAGGLIASAIIRSPLVAVVVGIAIASFMGYATAVADYLLSHSGSNDVLEVYSTAGLPRLGVAIVFLTLGVLLAAKWYRSGRLSVVRHRRSLIWLLWRSKAATVEEFLVDYSDVEQSAMVAGAWRKCPTPVRGRTIRMLWHAWRQLRTATFVYWAACAIPLFFVAKCLIHDLRHVQDATVFLIQLAILGGSIYAGYCFGPDQQKRFEPLAREGISPREIWFSRIAMTGLVLGVTAFFVLLAYWLVSLRMIDDPYWNRRHSDFFVQTIRYAPMLAIGLVVGYLAVGQAMSLFFRSRILAVFLTPFAILMLAIWTWYAVVFCRFSPVYGFWPIIAALLVSTWLLIGPRLRQENTWKVLRAPLLIIIGTSVVVFWSFIRFRVDEVKPCFLGYSRVSYEEVQDRANVSRPLNLGVVQGQWGTLQGLHGVLDRPDKTDRELTDVLLGAFADRFYAENSNYGWPRFNADETTYAELREIADDPRNVGRLRVCIDALEQWSDQRPPAVGLIQKTYERDLMTIWELDTRSRNSEENYESQLPWRFRYMPWEHERLLKIVDNSYQLVAWRTNHFEEQLRENGRKTFRSRADYDLRAADNLMINKHVSSIDEGCLEIEMDLISQFSNMVHLSRCPTFIMSPMYQSEAMRRATIVYLALRLYYEDHGRLPDSLGELEGEYLDELPCVPLSDEMLYYTAEPIPMPEVTGEDDYAQKNWQDTLNRLDSHHNFSKPFIWVPDYNGYDHLKTPHRLDGHYYIDADYGTIFDLNFVQAGEQPEGVNEESDVSMENEPDAETADEEPIFEGESASEVEPGT